MNTRTIKLMDCVTGTSTNTEAVGLYLAISNAFKSGAIVKLSLAGTTPMSSSFMNSSFGELVEEFGIETVKKQLRLVDFKPSQALQIKNYFETVSSYSR
ncbi:DUF4325 domain-containing protein [uncultured Pontibacter sp.]|uniref:STAS-like domain-containing protein n=1 Tax=uncultured Pontibacter sp. TaxID=453356 RepID=UPI002605A3C6|nr:DUF4325 domain-containing protein [uncultured Pontibacter sp.]